MVASSARCSGSQHHGAAIQGLSPTDVVNAIAAQNLIIPAGTAKIGTYEYEVELNAAPKQILELNDLPIKTSMARRFTF